MKLMLVALILLLATAVYADTIIPVPSMDEAGYATRQQIVNFLATPNTDLWNIIDDSNPNPYVPLIYVGREWNGSDVWQIAGITFDPETGYDSARDVAEPTLFASLLFGFALLGCGRIWRTYGNRTKQRRS